MEIKQTQLVLWFEEIQLLAVVTHMSLSEVWECSCEDAIGCLISMIADHDETLHDPWRTRDRVGTLGVDGAHRPELAPARGV